MKLIVGFITYGETTAKYLPYFLDSLKKQTFKDYKILAVDNSDQENNENKKFIENNYSGIDFNWAGKNLGYGKAFNQMIKKAAEEKAEFFLAINPDTSLEPDAIEKLILAIERDSNLGSVSPKILRWNFETKEKSKTIDTCGIILKRGLRFSDLGQGQKDEGQFDQAEILGPSGAAALYRLEALEKVKDKGQYFDERMFMYKEDCDLAYRLKLADFKAKLVPSSIIYHDRTVSSAEKGFLAFFRGRRSRNKQEKAWSFQNQHLIYLKYWKIQGFFAKIIIFLLILANLLLAMVFERYLLKSYKKIFSN